MTKEVTGLSPLEQEVLSRADNIFASVSTAAGQVVELGKEQLPDIAYQFIMYNRVYITSIVVAFTLLLIIQQIICIRIYRATDDYNKFDAGGAYTVCTVLALLVFASTVVPNFSKFVMVWAAPKLFLVIEITKLIKG